MTDDLDRVPTLRAAADARRALDSAMSLVEQKRIDLSNKLAAADTVLQETGAALDQLNAASATDVQTKAAAATEKSAAALKTCSELISAIGFTATAGSALDEWKECRVTIDRFDKILVDLRKTGFGFVTAIAAAAQFLFKDDNNFATKVALLAMLVVLIVTLYLIDLSHQVWLDVAVKKAKGLENVLFGQNVGLTSQISRAFAPKLAVLLGLFLYNVLLLATCAVFWFAAPRGEQFTGGHHGSVALAGLVGLVAIVGSCIFATDTSKTVRLGFAFALPIIFGLIIARALGTSLYFFR